MSMRTPTTRPVVVCGSDDATVRVWDLAAGRLLGGPLVHDHFVNAVAVGELHDRLLAASGDAGETLRPVAAVRDRQDILRPPSSSRRADGVVIDLDVVTCGSGSNKDDVLPPGGALRHRP
jgi:WD40 repeat protein